MPNTAAANPAPRVERNRAWVEREYGRDKWPSAVEALDQLIAEGETNLARIWAMLQRRHARLSNGGAADDGSRNCVIGQTVQSLPAALPWGAALSYVTESVIAASDGDPRLVVELGSGWGRMLLGVWLSGGPHATYAAGEITEPGRRCFERLAALEPSLPALSFPFDFMHSDLSSLRIGTGKAVVFTHHSIEQVPELGRRAITEICDLAPQVECLHFEPVGWQLAALDGHAAGPGSSREYADRHDYNRNLVGLLRALGDEGAIEIVRTAPNVVGFSETNALSLIHWRKT